MNWTRHQPLVSDGGDCGGDVQASESYEARWSAPLGNGMYAVVSRYYYLADWNERQRLEQQTEYLACTDLSDPGGTEVGSVGEYERLPVRDPRKAAEDAPAPTDAEWAKYGPTWVMAG